MLHVHSVQGLGPDFMTALTKGIRIMYQITETEISQVSGAADTWEDIGYAVGYAVGYFYRNVMIGNGVVDDIAQVTIED